MTIRPRRSLANPALQRPSALDAIPRDSDLLWLDKNENVDPALREISRAVLSELSPVSIATYPEIGATYRKLAQWVDVAPEQLLLTPGSDGAIRLVFEAFVEHGDAVIHTAPTFAMYPVYCMMFGATAHRLEYEPSENGPALKPDAIIAALREYKPKLLCLPNPDSPSGTVVNPASLREMLKVCEEVGAIFLVDEAYHPFYAWSAVPWTTASPNLIVARTFAKAWGAAGLRIGYAVAQSETIALLHKMRPMYEVGTLAVEFMSKMLDKSADVMASVSRITDGKLLFEEAMRAMHFPVISTHANFTHVSFGEQNRAVIDRLSKRIYYRASFDHPCLAGYSRFTVAPPAVMSEVIDLVKTAVKGI